MDRIEEIVTLTQAEFEAFAKMSGDHNPIHVDPSFAARTRFKGTVAHGIMLVVRLRALAAKLAPGASLLAQEAMFPAPTFAGLPLRFSAWRAGELNAFEAECAVLASSETTCRARFMLRIHA